MIEGMDIGYGDFEFERNFLADEPQGLRRESPDLILQGYFLAQDGYALRVRLQAPGITLDPMASAVQLLDQQEAAFEFCALTAKGPYIGGTRYEAERELDVAVGLQMVRRCPHIIVKNRYPLWIGSDGWVVDVFSGANSGLLIAEVERGGPVVDLEIPSFCRTELTGDERFNNEYLAVRPWKTFREDFLRELHTHGPRFRQEFGANNFSPEAFS